MTLTEQTEQTDEYEPQSTEMLAAEALVGMACILMGSDMLNRAVKKLRRRGLTLGTVTQSLSEGGMPALDTAGEPEDASSPTVD